MVVNARRHVGPLRRWTARSSCILACLAAAAILALSSDGLGGVRVQPLASASFNLQKHLPRSVNRFLAGSRKSKKTTIFQAGEYEFVILLPKRHIIPKPTFRKIPPSPIALNSITSSLEGDKEAVLGFPFTTTNDGKIEIGFPLIDGKLGLAFEDPPSSALLENEQVQGLTVSYGQRLPFVGLVDVRGSTSGDVGVSIESEIEELGDLKASLDSQLDWNVDLTSSYSDFKGVVPTVSYGATQDGMRASVKLESDLPRGARATVEVKNLPGKYAPADFLQDCRVVIASGQNSKEEPFFRHSLEAHARYDARLPEQPHRSDMTYSMKVGRASLDASIDYDHYRLHCRVPYAEATYAVSRSAPSVNPAMASLKLGKLFAEMHHVDGEPRYRASFAR